MLSTKSRLLTRLPGAKKRISIVFAGSRAGRGANQRPQQQRHEDRARSRSGRAVNGKAQHVGRRTQARRPAAPRRQPSGTAILSCGTGKPAFGDVKDALRRAAVALRVVQHALRSAVRLQIRGELNHVPVGGSDIARARPGAVEDERIAGSRGARRESNDLGNCRGNPGCGCPPGRGGHPTGDPSDSGCGAAARQCQGTQHWPCCD